MLALWSTSHQELKRGDVRSWRASKISDGVRKGFERLEPYFGNMQAAAKRLIQAGEAEVPNIRIVPDAVSVILDNEAEYLRHMDGVVSLYESEAGGSRASAGSVGPSRD